MPYLKETVTSVLQQTFTDWEWLITDDGSTDGSLEYLKSLQHPQISLQTTEGRAGAGEARNIALKKAQGRYITFLDADDYWEPNFLEEMLEFMRKEQAELAYCTYARCNDELKPVLADFQADIPVTFSNVLKTCRLSLLASVYDSQRVGKFYFPKGSKREDHVMWLNLLKHIPQGLPYPKTLAKYRMLANSVSRKKSKIMKDQYLVYKEHMKFSTLKSLYYTAHWALNGFKKYSKWFN